MNVDPAWRKWLNFPLLSWEILDESTLIYEAIYLLIISTRSTPTPLPNVSLSHSGLLSVEEWKTEFTCPSRTFNGPHDASSHSWYLVLEVALSIFTLRDAVTGIRRNRRSKTSQTLIMCAGGFTSQRYGRTRKSWFMAKKDSEDMKIKARISITAMLGGRA